MNDSPTFAAGAFAGRYQINGELGQGATAIVYLARDTVYGRDVALKVLRPELTAAISIDRFLREIRVTAQLQHPNIISVLDSGQDKDKVFCVLPYMEGGTLRRTLAREKQMPLSDVIDIGITVARALDFAHSQNVMHRDVKPENILFAGGRASLADFGIAKAIERSGGESTTSTGIVRGTPAYMSPEQASGSEYYDGRSDIYSLGCVLYEMIAGVPVFVGPTPQSVIAQRLVHDPRPLRQYRPRTPAQLQAVIEKALAMTPADRYQTAGEFADALERARDASSVPPRRVPRAAFAAVVGMAAVVAAVAIVGRALRQEPPPPTALPRIAVLPFAHQGNASDGVFADGLTDELTTRIAALSGFSVISRTSAVQYDRARKPLAQIGRELGADYILTGSIQTDRRPDGTGQTRVSPELIRASTGQLMWAGRQVASLVPGALFAVQSSIAESVAVNLQVAILRPERAMLAAQPTADQGAYEAFLRGNLFAANWHAEESMRRAIAEYQLATTRDPRFALAFARLAKVQSVYYSDFERTARRRQLAREALDRALALDASLPATRLALGFYHWWVHRDYDSAMVHLRAVQQAQPNNVELLSVMARAYASRGRWNDVLSVAETAARLDPRSQSHATDLATTLLWIRRYAESDREFRRAIALSPTYVPPYYTRAYLQVLWRGDRQGFLNVLRDAAQHIDSTQIVIGLMPEYRELIAFMDEPWHAVIERLSRRTASVDPAGFHLTKGEHFARRGNTIRARAHFDSARIVLEPRIRADSSDPQSHSDLAFAYAGLGRPEDAIREGRRGVELAPASRSVTANLRLRFNLARLYVAIGHHDKAIEELRFQLRSETRNVSAQALLQWPDFAPLRELPAFKALLSGAP